MKSYLFIGGPEDRQIKAIKCGRTVFLMAPKVEKEGAFVCPCAEIEPKPIECERINYRHKELIVVDCKGNKSKSVAIYTCLTDTELFDALLPMNEDGLPKCHGGPKDGWSYDRDNQDKCDWEYSAGLLSADTNFDLSAAFPMHEIANPNEVLYQIIQNYRGLNQKKLSIAK